MNLIQWDPWQELERVRLQTDRLWDTYLRKLSERKTHSQEISFLPDVDFVETAREYRVYLSMPGFVEEDIDLLLGDQFVVVRGEREPPYDPTHSRCRVGEWRYGFFERRIQLPTAIVSEQIRANYDAGVLTILIPKVQ